MLNNPCCCICGICGIPLLVAVAVPKLNPPPAANVGVPPKPGVDLPKAAFGFVVTDWPAPKVKPPVTGTEAAPEGVPNWNELEPELDATEAAEAGAPN